MTVKLSPQQEALRVKSSLGYLYPITKSTIQISYNDIKWEFEFHLYKNTDGLNRKYWGGGLGAISYWDDFIMWAIQQYQRTWTQRLRMAVHQWMLIEMRTSADDCDTGCFLLWQPLDVALFRAYQMGLGIMIWKANFSRSARVHPKRSWLWWSILWIIVKFEWLNFCFF